MSEAPKGNLLIARWETNRDPITEEPCQVIWANGTTADVRDYHEHATSTHTWISTTSGIELHMFPHLIGSVRHDVNTGIWVLEGAGPSCIALDVADVDATDDEIIAALYTQVVVYRVQIHRHVLPAEANGEPGRKI